ncbi:TetR/AcrR family transcriptional regulator [Demequina oxidasica]|uniref:TetR/AcrR family transcriptional regulator n=1 Tax=Demequina oxidasica TaxID=676199 RepID=UPI0007807366|nr:TetR/AcrR family transcriptional regulator [Demequina oxidasica]
MSDTTATRGSYAKTADRRRDILDAAFEVFAESGYTNGSLRTVADRVGLSQAGILFHFKSKTGLLQAVLDLRDERSREYFATVTSPGIEALRGFLEVVRMNCEEPGMIELYAILAAEGTAEEHPAHEYFRGRYDWIGAQARQSFIVMREEGTLRPGVEPGHAARSMMAIVDGLQLQWLYGRTKFDLVADVRTHLQSLVTVAL